MISSWGLKIPRKGSGKNGRIKIIDLTRVLVNHFLGDWSDEDREAHAAKMAGKVTQREVEEMEPELLEAVSKLDEKEQGSFKDIVAECVSCLEQKHHKAASNKRPKPAPEVESDKPAANTAAAEVTAEADSNTGGPASSSKGLSSDALPPAREKVSKSLRDDVASEKKAAGVRRPAPPEIASLFPKLPGLYIKWLSNDRRIAIEFSTLAGSGFQRTKSASWPQYCGIGPKENAVHTVLSFVVLALKVHFKEFKNEDGSSWVMPSREQIRRNIEALLNRELREKKAT